MGAYKAAWRSFLRCCRTTRSRNAATDVGIRLRGVVSGIAPFGYALRRAGAGFLGGKPHYAAWRGGFLCSGTYYAAREWDFYAVGSITQRGNGFSSFWVFITRCGSADPLRVGAFPRLGVEIRQRRWSLLCFGAAQWTQWTQWTRSVSAGWGCDLVSAHAIQPTGQPFAFVAGGVGVFGAAGEHSGGGGAEGF